jgi:molecular chaperone GrpE
MSDRKNAPVSPPEDQPGDVEILEIVGLEDDPPPSAGWDDGELEVVLEEPLPESPPESEKPASEDCALRERLLRLQADFENLKKRTERERSDHYRHATGVLVARLLPVLDNFDRAIASYRDAHGDQNFRDGVLLIHHQLMEELRREGLQPVPAEGQPFDPNVHEAVATQVADGHPPNVVLEELQRGYFFHERLLRPALVRVSVEAIGEGEGHDSRGKEC